MVFELLSRIRGLTKQVHPHPPQPPFTPPPIPWGGGGMGFRTLVLQVLQSRAMANVVKSSAVIKQFWKVR